MNGASVGDDGSGSCGIQYKDGGFGLSQRKQVHASLGGGSSRFISPHHSHFHVHSSRHNSNASAADALAEADAELLTSGTPLLGGPGIGLCSHGPSPRQ